MLQQKSPKYHCCSQDVHVPCFPLCYMVGVGDDWVSAEVDLITFLIATELMQGKHSLEKVLPSDVSISHGCKVAAQVSVAMIISRWLSSPLFLEVCACVQWLW